MILSERAITDFKQAYFQDFGKEVNDEVAQEVGAKLLDFFALVYRPIPKEININELVKDKKYGKEKFK